MFMYNLKFKLYMNIPMRKLQILSNFVYYGRLVYITMTMKFHLFKF